MKKYIRRNKVLFVTTVITSVIGSLGYVGIAVLLQHLLDIAVSRNLSGFTEMVLFSLGYFLLLGMFLYMQALFSKKVICKIMYQIRFDSFKGTLEHTFQDFSKKNTADYISAITNDVKILEDNFLLPLFEVVQYSVIFVSSFMLMIYFDPLVTVCTLAAIAVLFVIPSLFGTILEKRQGIFSQKMSGFTADLKDIFSGFEVIKSYSMERYIACRFNKSNEDAAEAKYSVDKIVALNEGASAFLALMVQVVVLFLSAYFIITGRLTAGTLLGLVQVSSNLANPLVIIFTNIPKMKSVKPVIDRLNKLSDYKKEYQDKNVPEFQQKISVTNLCFSYHEEKEVLHNINCVIEKGKKYAVVGKSGCGKSTLIKLLAGYFSDYSGDIFYDGIEMGVLNRNAVSQLSSIIHQNIYMFDETIYDNICLHENYAKEMVDRAVRDSGLSEFVSELQDGLYYKVGENGCNLSGGQKQRIAVARALIRNKPVLILDEGTSAVDRQTAYDIENRLLQIGGLTLINITHNTDSRLLKLYDCIWKIENGMLEEI